MLEDKMQTINLRDDIPEMRKVYLNSYDVDELSNELLYSIELLEKIQNILIGLTDEDWDQLNLDVEFIL